MKAMKEFKPKAAKMQEPKTAEKPMKAPKISSPVSFKGGSSSKKLSGFGGGKGGMGGGGAPQF